MLHSTADRAGGELGDYYWMGMGFDVELLMDGNGLGFMTFRRCGSRRLFDSVRVSERQTCRVANEGPPCTAGHCSSLQLFGTSLVHRSNETFQQGTLNNARLHPTPTSLQHAMHNTTTQKSRQRHPSKRVH